ncbi:hypothetical protein [Sphingobacterium paucimobilis]|uniref:Uncharacterized protein n=1 Tax=Sphingobacterium paucimobilis HER1398 TaxID=1346330 RepID=U2IYB4_9SPHI|nr:hypothetical protein [Sphingobacterium paucimobilis]ERJ57684.1 hypothetical protein M472_02785 [Sphingobacterium paucimobilis HER1398]
MKNFLRGGRGTLCDQNIKSEQQIIKKLRKTREERKLMSPEVAKFRVNRTRRYNRLLSPVHDKFESLDLNTFRPFKVVEEFWWKYRCDGAKFNLYDLILSARSTVRKSNGKLEDLNNFLDDFSLFMIASYIIHYMDYDDSAVGKYVFFDDQKNIKEEIRFSFLETLVGIQKGGGHV